MPHYWTPHPEIRLLTTCGRVNLPGASRDDSGLSFSSAAALILPYKNQSMGVAIDGRHPDLRDQEGLQRQLQSGPVNVAHVGRRLRLRQTPCRRNSSPFQPRDTSSGPWNGLNWTAAKSTPGAPSRFLLRSFPRADNGDFVNLSSEKGAHAKSISTVIEDMPGSTAGRPKPLRTCAQLKRLRRFPDRLRSRTAWSRGSSVCPQSWRFLLIVVHRPTIPLRQLGS